jgi:alginate O-acetyltransferase complex protein AlgI
MIVPQCTKAKGRIQMELFGISFLFYFLPLFLGVYYITSDKNKPLAIFLSSVIFYLLQDGVRWWQVALAILLTIITYLLGRWSDKYKGVLVLGIALLAGVLVFFKGYRGGVLLPAGMSFYLFQMGAYLIDLRRGRIAPEENFLAYGAQILMFPRLLSGPLMEPAQLQAQMAHPKINQYRFRAGLQELVLGLGMKVLLADRLGAVWNQMQVVGLESLSAIHSWMSLISFALRLYFDFYGYSLMAVGIGKLMGFELPRNFDSPYAARSVSDFYRRWHMTLTGWFRRYVYIPLGGNRKGKLRTAINILIVWTLTGLWHGVGGNYLLWGGFLGFIMVVEKLWLGKRLERMVIFPHIYTVSVILLSWIPFALGSYGDMLDFIKGLFGKASIGGAEISAYLPLIAVGGLFVTSLPERFFHRYREKLWFDCVLFVLFWICIFFVSTTAQDPFMYYNF